jgi:hypothetical protein
MVLDAFVNSSVVAIQGEIAGKLTRWEIIFQMSKIAAVRYISCKNSFHPSDKDFSSVVVNLPVLNCHHVPDDRLAVLGQHLTN